jgi:hypothetical protein
MGHWKLQRYNECKRVALNGLEKVMGEFPDAFRPVEAFCPRIRKIL